MTAPTWRRGTFTSIKFCLATSSTRKEAVDAVLDGLAGLPLFLDCFRGGTDSSSSEIAGQRSMINGVRERLKIITLRTASNSLIVLHTYYVKS